MLALRQSHNSQGGSMADGEERREARQFTMSLPMRVLPREAKGYELDAHTRDLSYRGLYFLTDAKFEIGNEIEFVITLPQQMTQAGDVISAASAKLCASSPPKMAEWESPRKSRATNSCPLRQLPRRATSSAIRETDLS